MIPRTNGHKVYDIKKLNDPEVAARYVNNLKSQTEIDEYALDLDNGNWTGCKQIIGNSAEAVIKEEGRRKRSEWFNNECKEVTLKKNLAYKEMIHYTREAIENYKQLGREEKNVHKKKKRTYQEEILKEIEELTSHNETRRFYRRVNDMKKEINPRILACQKKDGEIITNNCEILERWNQYFKELLDGKEENDEVDNPIEVNKEYQDRQEGTYVTYSR
jgi:hypothetical protein